MAAAKSLSESPLPSSVSSRIRLETVRRAVNALLKWKSSKSKARNPQISEQDDFMYLVLTLTKIPPKDRTHPHKISLPYPLYSPQDSSQLCLIVGDRPKSKLTSDHAQKLIKSQAIPVAKVIRLSKLKSDYRDFEAKRKLCDSYDLFFADKPVVPLLPKVLGKQFFRKKTPIPVDLTHNNWKEQIEIACSSTLLCLRTGTCSAVRVGSVSMESGEIVENVVAAIDEVVEYVPKKWARVRSFHLKFSESLALPIYQALPNMMLKNEGVKNNGEDMKKDGSGEMGIKEESNEKNKKLGSKKIFNNGNVDEDEDELGSNDVEDAFESETGGGDNLISTEIAGKKRKKRGSLNHNDDVLKHKKDGFCLDDSESVGRKEKKKSGLGKLKDGAMKAKSKIAKKRQTVSDSF